VVQPTEDAAVELALRLRSLRLRALGAKITQADLAEALGRSEALISSWEHRTTPVTPPAEQLLRYATFFCTSRSVAGRPYRVLADEELNQNELADRNKLRDELLALRTAATAPNGAAGPYLQAAAGTLVGRGPWHFPDYDERPIVIVCPELPESVLAGMPHAQESDLDYSELSRLTDLDSLFELHGHIRAVNPDVRVEYRSVHKMRRDDSTGHLVVLGGVDWNPAQRDVMSRIGAPIEQISKNDPLHRGYFQVIGDDTETYRPVINKVAGKDVLLEDVGYFFRGPNPFNQQRTVTLCNGEFSRGVLGAVRALTDKQLRDGNADYLSRTFGDDDSYSILFRVPIINERVVVTPDWTAPGTVLHTWSEKTE
jgi:transcriptional regulator with XRE-family HTH domain